MKIYLSKKFLANADVYCSGPLSEASPAAKLTQEQQKARLSMGLSQLGRNSELASVSCRELESSHMSWEEGMAQLSRHLRLWGRGVGF